MLLVFWPDGIMHEGEVDLAFPPTNTDIETGYLHTNCYLLFNPLPYSPYPSAHSPRRSSHSSHFSHS